MLADNSLTLNFRIMFVAALKMCPVEKMLCWKGDLVHRGGMNGCQVKPEADALQVSRRSRFLGAPSAKPGKFGGPASAHVHLVAAPLLHSFQ